MYYWKWETGFETSVPAITRHGDANKKGARSWYDVQEQTVMQEFL